jgi:hypothetical protein
MGKAVGLSLAGAIKECTSMCDFSLHAVKSRPAKVGDRLTTHDFGRGTRGFAAAEDANVAVCLLPGTELSFGEGIEIGRSWLWSRPDKYQTAIFRQVNQHNPRTHHDALEFPDGRLMLLTLMPPGREATVLQLPVTAVGQPVAQRAEYV